MNTRPPARAGQFYPGDPGAMNKMVDDLLAAGARTANAQVQNFRAVMLPHAGWVFCGSTLAKTLARAAVPDTVIIVGPRHTPYGANWSIAPHSRWDIPGASIPVATDLVSRLTHLLPELTPEPEAHRMERGTEVLLPFLHRRNPNLRIMPIVLGQADYAQTGRIAQALATVVAETDTPILLVISSDMNHFAPEAENRRLDLMALNAMCTGDPRKLAEVVVANRISMCGAIPALAIMQALQRQMVQIEPELIDYTNSAAASGDASRVVGYGGVVIP